MQALASRGFRIANGEFHRYHRAMQASSAYLVKPGLLKRWLLVMGIVTACSSDGGSPASPNPTAEPSGTLELNPAANPASQKEQDVADPCLEALRAHRETLATLVGEHSACEFDHECVTIPTEEQGCYQGCPVALHSRGVGALRARMDSGHACPANCSPQPADCDANLFSACLEGHCRLQPHERDAAQGIPVPVNNRPGSEPPRPTPGDKEQERASRLFEAIRHDDPARAADFFFPKEAFYITKAISDPDAYWDRLFRRYQRDIHALHESLAQELGDEGLSAAQFDRLDIIWRGGWVPVREEGNALPYWVSRHSMLYYRSGESEKRFEVRVLITWADRWYITHLSEFH